MCPDTERCFLCVRVRLCLRVFPISRSSLIIELILSSLLGRYTAASHSVFLSFSSLLRRSILPSPYFHLCRSPFIYHPFSFLTPLSSLCLMCSPSLRPFPQLSSLTNPSCSLTSLSPYPSAASPSTPLPSIIPLLLPIPTPCRTSLHPPEVRGRCFLSTVRLKPAATRPVGGGVWEVGVRGMKRMRTWDEEGHIGKERLKE